MKKHFSTVALNEMLCPVCDLSPQYGVSQSWYYRRLSKTVTTIDQHSSLALPREALDALGVEAGAELEVEIVGRALIIRSVKEARRSSEFISAFESILFRRRNAYEELAHGPEL